MIGFEVEWEDSALKKLRKPTRVNQRTAFIPDGRPDPAADTDCGEAVIASAFSGLFGLYLSPGCIRQRMQKPMNDGRTTPNALEDDFNNWGGAAHHVDGSGWSFDKEWEYLHKLRAHQRYVACLGNFQGSDMLHWVLAYERAPDNIFVMDPWTGEYREIGKRVFQGMDQRQYVVMWPPQVTLDR